MINTTHFYLNNIACSCNKTVFLLIEAKKDEYEKWCFVDCLVHICICTYTYLAVEHFYDTSMFRSDSINAGVFYNSNYNQPLQLFQYFEAFKWNIYFSLSFSVIRPSPGARFCHCY